MRLIFRIKDQEKSGSDASDNRTAQPVEDENVIFGSPREMPIQTQIHSGSSPTKTILPKYLSFLSQKNLVWILIIRTFMRM